MLRLNPSKYGYTQGIADGQRSARDSSPVCGEYNSTADANACYKAYDLGFKKGCENNHDHTHDDGSPEHPPCS